MINATLDNIQLHRAAPSIFAEEAYSQTSSRYGFIPTIHVVDALRGLGWLPVKAVEQRCRKADKRGYTKHLIRFRHSDSKALQQVGDSLPEVVLLNSHDATSAYQMHAGLFRLVCSNGLVVADSTFNKISIRHSGDVIGRVIEGVAQIVEETPAIADSVARLQHIHLTEKEQHVYAAAALTLKYDEPEAAPITSEKLLKPRRGADSDSSLWSTFNRVQENLIRGGLLGRNARGMPARTRAINSITEDTRINKALWLLTETMAGLKV